MTALMSTAGRGAVIAASSFGSVLGEELSVAALGTSGTSSSSSSGGTCFAALVIGLGAADFGTIGAFATTGLGWLGGGGGGSALATWTFCLAAIAVLASAMRVSTMDRFGAVGR